jgi:hypothetical protein
MTTTAAERSAPTRSPSGADIALALAGLGVLSLALFFVELDRAFGLPAHPLLLHIPVVLIPILGLTLLVFAARPAWFERYALAFGAFTVITLAATILTAGAGEAFRADRPVRPDEAHRLSEHADSGDTLRLVMVGLAAIVLFAVLLSQAREGTRLGRLSGLASSRVLRTGLRVLFAVGAVAAVFLVIRTGHLGAQLTWHGEGGGPPGREP